MNECVFCRILAGELPASLVYRDERCAAFMDIRPVNPGHLLVVPIRTIDFSDPADRARHERMVELVERMLSLHQRLAAAQTPPEKALLQRQIAATDEQIDRLVYELYNLTEEEIALVEGKS